MKQRDTHVRNDAVERGTLVMEGLFVDLADTILACAQMSGSTSCGIKGKWSCLITQRHIERDMDDRHILDFTQNILENKL